MVAVVVVVKLVLVLVLERENVTDCDIFTEDKNADMVPVPEYMVECVRTLIKYYTIGEQWKMLGLLFVVHSVEKNGKLGKGGGLACKVITTHNNRTSIKMEVNNTSYILHQWTRTKGKKYADIETARKGKRKRDR